MKHELKTRHKFFRSLWAGTKTFEIRNNDRDFTVDDEVELIEIQDTDLGTEHVPTGREIRGWITYLTDFEQKPGYVVFGIKESYRRDE